MAVPPGCRTGGTGRAPGETARRWVVPAVPPIRPYSRLYGPASVTVVSRLTESPELVVRTRNSFIHSPGIAGSPGECRRRPGSQTKILLR